MLLQPLEFARVEICRSCGNLRCTSTNLDGQAVVSVRSTSVGLRIESPRCIGDGKRHTKDGILACVLAEKNGNSAGDTDPLSPIGQPV